MYYNKRGKAISKETWDELIADQDYKVVKQEDLPDATWISTVYLGINYHCYDDYILIFETIIFGSKLNPGIIHMEKYSNFEAAQEGHEIMKRKYVGELK